MRLNQKIGVCLLTSALALNSCTSSAQIKTLEDKVQNLEQKISRITLANNIRDVDELHLKMIAPTVRVELELTHESKIGAGTVLYSKRNSNTLVYSYILTSAHIVSTTAEEFSIKAYNYKSERSRKRYSAETIALNRVNDLAILEVISDEEFNVAKLIPKDNIASVKVFDKIYAVGCPTEDSPLQSYGEITNKTPSERNFWRISAPTAHGNSGGGIFLENTKELVGVLCKGETEAIEHRRRDGRTSATKDHYIEIPHLSIATNPNAIYNFLEEQNLQFIYDNNFTREECLERRER